MSYRYWLLHGYFSAGLVADAEGLKYLTGELAGQPLRLLPKKVQTLDKIFEVDGGHFELLEPMLSWKRILKRACGGNGGGPIGISLWTRLFRHEDGAILTMIKNLDLLLCLGKRVEMVFSKNCVDM